MKYKTLLFDLDGTILDYSRSESAALFGAYDKIFGATPPDGFLSVYQNINSSLWKEFEKDNISINSLKKKRFSDLLKEFSLNCDPLKFSKVYLEELAAGGYLVDGSLDVLKLLHPNYRMGAVTNGIGVIQRSRIEKAGIGGYFETLIISDEIGIAKPDPDFFRITMEKMGIENRSEMLMIGDSLSSDILGGLNAGIDTCWINRNKIEQNEIIPSYTISDITELLKIIGEAG